MRRDRTKWGQVVVASGAALAVVGWPAPAHAHGVELDHEQVGAVAVEAVYDTGEPMADAQVLVYSPDDDSDPWETGSADDEGNFLFEPTDTGTWVVEVRQAGHGGVLEIPVEDTALPSDGSEEEDQEGPDEPGDQEPAPQGADSDESGEDTGADSDGTSASGAAASPLQIVTMGVLAVWGFVGTALYFVSRKRA